MKRWLRRLLLLTAVGLVAFWFGNDQLDRMYAKEQIDSGSGTQVLLGDGWVDVEKKQNENRVQRVVDHELFFLLAGVDQNDGEEGGQTRSDTLMLFKVDFEKGTIDLLSLPRDSRVEVEGAYTKLNHAHAYGGIDLTVSAIRDWLGLDLDYYVEVDFEAVKQIVDGFGGITFDVPEGVDFDYWTLTEEPRHLSPGSQVLDGEAALAFLRHRNSYPTGDLGRVAAQQAFLKAVVQKVFSEDVIGRLPSLLKIYFDSVKTNLPWNEIVGLLPKLGTLKNATLRTYTIPGEGTYLGEVSYFLADVEKTQELVQSLFPKYILHPVAGAEKVDGDE